MPTPNTYDQNFYKSIISRAQNIYHQTSVNNLENMLSDGALYSPATLFGLNIEKALSFYNINNTRRKNLNMRADKGFMDYVFCSFTNGVRISNPRYGTLSIEINKDILLNKECFIYPFNFIFAWDRAKLTDKYSDLSIWDHVISQMDRKNSDEILIRRKINFDKYLVKIHCFDSQKSKVLAILKKSKYGDYKIESHADPIYKNVGGYNTMQEAIALINNEQYKAILSEDKKFATIFSIVENEMDTDILGRFEVSDNLDLIENFPMSKSSAIIGKLSIKQSSILQTA